MKKLLYMAVAAIVIMFAGCTDYGPEIEDLKDRIEGIENTKIASLLKQVESITKSIPQLEKTDSELKKYIEQLQATEANLQAQLAATNAKIDEVKATLKSDLLKQLEDLQNDLQKQIDFINNVITTLQKKDRELEQKIEDLEKRVADLAESNGSTEWIIETFATLEQHYELSADVATIKKQIESITRSISELESRLNYKIENELSGAMAELAVEIQHIIAEITTAYQNAIAEAKSEITSAYTEAIRSAIANLESSIKTWVNEKLDGYCTIAKMEGELSVLFYAMNDGDRALQDEITRLSNALTASKAEITKAYTKAIEDAINNDGGLINNKIAAEIAVVNNRIEEEVAAIHTRISTLEKRVGLVEDKISSIEEQMANINATIGYLQTVRDQLEDSIAEIAQEGRVTAAELDRLKNKLDELDAMIVELRQYVSTELASMTNWANATFATLDQYDILARELESIQTLIELYNSRHTQELENAIELSQDMMRSWVSNQLNGYCTIAEFEGRLAELQNAALSGDETLQEQIDQIKDILSSLKNESEESFRAAINDAIEENNGLIDAKIQRKFEEVNQRIANEVAQISSRLDDLEIRLAKLERDIASISDQMGYIRSTLSDLQDADDEIMQYISYLEQTIQSLVKSRDETNNRIADIEDALQNGEGMNSTEILAYLNLMRSELDNEIDQMNTTLAKLQAKDEELKQEIAALKEYVDSEISATKKWAEATFATLGHFNYLSGELTTIKQQIESMNMSMKELEARMNAKISNEIASVISTFDAQMQQQLNEITSAYAAAIAASRAEIEKAYSEAIQIAIASSEASMRMWVNEQLKGYYSIAEVDAMLEAMAEEFDSKLNAQRSYFESMINSLSDRLQNEIDVNEALIFSLRSDVTELQGASAEYATAIADHSAAIARNTSAIVNNTASISANAYEIDALKSKIEELRAIMNGEIYRLEQLLTNAGSTTTEEVNQRIEAVRQEYNAKIEELQNDINAKVRVNEALIATNSSNINANANAIAANTQALQSLQSAMTTANAMIINNAGNIAKNAEDIAKNAALIATNAAAISNNSNEIAVNAAEIWQMKQDLISAKNELTAAYTAAIETAIESLGGELRDEIAVEVATINSRLDAEIATIDGKIATLTNRVNQLERDMENVHQQIADILRELAELRKDIEDLMKRIQSVSYIPKYSDGKATVFYTGTADGSYVEMDFMVSPKSTVADIASNYANILSIQAVNTITRAVNFIDMPIMSCVADAANGVLTIKASAVNLPETFFNGETSASAALCISDGNTNISSEFIPMVATICQISYTSSNGNVVNPYRTSAFGANIVSNTYENGNGVMTFDGPITSIGYGAFKNCSSLIGITIPNSVTSIGEWAFSECGSLTSITIPNSVTSIEASAFNKCKKLVNISIPNSVTSIGDDAFFNCISLTNITIPENVTSIGGWAFGYCNNLTNINLPDGVVEIEEGLFYDCGKLNELTIPNSVTSIGENAFYGCSSLTSITIPENVTSIGEEAFSNCSQLNKFYGKFAEDSGRCLIKDGEIIAYANASGREYTIPSSVNSIGRYAFSHADLKNITIPNSVTNIKYVAFGNCSSLTEITIPKSVTSIEDLVFYQCSGLQNIICESATPPTAGLDMFYNIHSSAKIYVPAGSGATYKAASGWSDYADLIVEMSIPNNNEILYTTTDGEIAKLYKQDAFDVEVVSNTYENGVGKIVCNADITEIIYYAFRGCENLQTITFPASVAKIGQYAIYSCPNLTAIYCKATTPPAIYYQYAQIGSFPFQPGMKIYVPREAIDAYTQYSPDRWAEMSYDPFNWSQYQSYIEPYDF